ncbi:MAG: DUF6308 family protein [Acidimicrobiales bacterium]
MTTHPPLVLAGRPVEHATDLVRRYCGLGWSGGPPETWAYRYYDLVESDSDSVTQVDVLAASALHPGLARSDLAWFWDRSAELDAWLAGLPGDVSLADAEAPTLSRLDELADWSDGPALTLVSKVLHRKRPHLIPLVDRHILDWYRPVTSERSAPKAWASLLRTMQHDLIDNRPTLDAIVHELGDELARPISHLRIVDIAVWMGAQ